MLCIIYPPPYGDEIYYANHIKSGKVLCVPVLLGCISPETHEGPTFFISLPLHAMK